MVSIEKLKFEEVVSISPTTEKKEIIFRTILAKAKEITSCDYAAIYEFYLSERNHLKIAALAGIPLIDKQKNALFTLEDRSINALVAREGIPYMCNDTGNDPNYYPLHPDVRSEMTIPIKYQNRVIGTLDLESKKLNAFSSDQQHIIELLANAAAPSIYLDQVSQRIKVVNEAVESIADGIRLTKEKVVEIVHEQISKLLDANNMYLALYDQNEDKVSFAFARVAGKQIDITNEDSYKPRKGGKGRTEWIIHNRQPLFHPTFKDSEEWYKQPSNKEYGGVILSSWMGVPMIASGKVLGVIAVYHDTLDNVYSEEDLYFLRIIASQAAIALEKIKLSEELTARKSLDNVGIIVAALLHRTNNTMSLIRPNISRIRRRLISEDLSIKESLDIIDRNAGYISEMMDRIRKQSMAIEYEPYDIHSPIEVVIAAAEEARLEDLNMPPIIVERNYDESIPELLIPVPQITEVFRILIENAYRLMPQGGVLTVSSKRIDNRVHIRIKDTGPGIRAKVRKNLFLKPVPSKSGEGFGIGLWLSHLMLEGIGGSIQETAPASGAEFFITIPIRRAEHE